MSSRGASVCRLVRGAKGRRWSCTSLPPSLNGQRVLPDQSYKFKYWLWRVQCCATLPSFFLLGTIRNQLQVNASTFAAATGQWLYRCVGWRSGDDGAWPQRYLRRRASSLNNAGRWQMLKIFLAYKRRNDARESHEYNEPGAGGGGTRGEKEGKAMHCTSRSS